jgi:hypothetical protein
LIIDEHLDEGLPGMGKYHAEGFVPGFLWRSTAQWPELSLSKALKMPAPKNKKIYASLA